MAGGRRARVFNKGESRRSASAAVSPGGRGTLAYGMRPFVVRCGPILLAALLACCATNPARDKGSLEPAGDGLEELWGKQADEQLRGWYGNFPETRIQAYVESVARPLAAASARPQLPWKFLLLDEEQINALALPGGSVYLTRGLLAHLNSEAELAAVLAHQIGHVTGGHWGRAQAAPRTLAFGPGPLAAPYSALRLGADGLAEAHYLLSLGFGPEQETEADVLGIRCIAKKGFDPDEMLDLLWMLDGTSARGDDGLVPNWRFTHQAPGNRVTAIKSEFRALGAKGRRVGRPEFLRRLDGLAYGPDPRRGFFKAEAFYRPDLSFKITFPAGWATRVERRSASATPSAEDAVLQVVLSHGELDDAAAAFSGREHVRAGDLLRRQIGGYEVVTVEFEITDPKNRALQGMTSFFASGGTTLQLIAYSPSARYDVYRPVFEEWLSSLEPLRDPSILKAVPMRLKIETLRARGTISTLALGWKSPVKAETLALLNEKTLTQLIAAGSQVKRVIGEAFQ